MKLITDGVTTAAFLAAINGNLDELAAYRGVSAYTHLVASDDYVAKLNEYYGETIVSDGMTGSTFANSITYNFITRLGLPLDPSAVQLTWIDDYVKIDFTDNSDGSYQHEIYQSVNSGEYTLIGTVNAGITTLNYNTYQNASVKFKVRAKKGSVYSGYSTEATIATPFVLLIDTSVSTQHGYQYFNVKSGKSVTIDWGDGTTTVRGYAQNGALTKTYSTVGQFYMIITGDTDQIKDWYMDGDSYTNHTNVSARCDKWILPSVLETFEFWRTNISSDISGWVLPSTLLAFNIQNSHFTGDLSGWVLPSLLYDFYLNNNNFTGNLQSWVIPANMSQFNIGTNDFTWDITNIGQLSSASQGYCSWGMRCSGISGSVSAFTMVDNTRVWDFTSSQVTGDLSGLSLPAGSYAKQLVFNGGPKLTKMPRGAFRWISQFEFNNNNCNQAEIDSLLVHIDNYFTGGVVPLTNAVYDLSGASMGTPSATGLAARTSILSKYTAAGKTCTITVNS